MTKLYFLQPNSWDRHWTTCADTPEQALNQIKDHMKIEEEKYDMHDFVRFTDSTPTDLPEGYDLHEYPLNHVIEGEYS